MKCLYDKNFRRKAFYTHNPYGIGNAGKKIANFINKIQLNKNFTKKDDY